MTHPPTLNRHRASLCLHALLAFLIVLQSFSSLFFFGFKLGTQLCDLPLERCTLSLDVALSALIVLRASNRSSSIDHFLCNTSRPGQDPAAAQVGIDELHTLRCQLIFANLIGMVHAARLEYINSAIALAVAFQLHQRQPGVHER